MDDGYRIVRPFNIDDGELDGISRQESFVLGYELALVDVRLETEPGGFEMPVHADNRGRIQSHADKIGRIVRMDWMPSDKSESWMTLVAGPKDNST